MRLTPSLLLVALLPSAALAQAKAPDPARLETIKYVRQLQTPSGGFAPSKPEGDAKPTASLRATSAAVRALKYVTGQPVKEAVPDAAKVAEFVMSCYDPKTGAFADAPGGKPEVNVTSVGVMAAVELDVPKEKFRKAMDYIQANAKTWEEVRLGAAAVEAWGVKDCPFKLDGWREIRRQRPALKLTFESLKDGEARTLGSMEAFDLRLGFTKPAFKGNQFLDFGKRDDGGWGKEGAKESDLETTYRVMRAYYMDKGKPKDVAKLREFIARCRNADGGYGTKPGDKSSVGGVYYAAIVTKWLDEMEKK
jgi:prenyltransferase beta subunit